jgi:hypothetical protein
MRWEFRQVMTTAVDFETILNELGDEGWDLVYVTVLAGTSPVELIGILKRERPAGESPPKMDSGFI